MESELERGVFAILQATVIIHSRDYGIPYYFQSHKKSSIHGEFHCRDSLMHML